VDLDFLPLAGLKQCGVVGAIPRVLYAPHLAVQPRKVNNSSVKDWVCSFACHNLHTMLWGDLHQLPIDYTCCPLQCYSLCRGSQLNQVEHSAVNRVAWVWPVLKW